MLAASGDLSIAVSLQASPRYRDIAGNTVAAVSAVMLGFLERGTFWGHGMITAVWKLCSRLLHFLPHRQSFFTLKSETIESTWNFLTYLVKYKSACDRPCLQECISQSAVETKFQQHTTNGKQIVRELHSMMEIIFESALSRGYVLHFV